VPRAIIWLHAAKAELELNRRQININLNEQVAFGRINLVAKLSTDRAPGLEKLLQSSRHQKKLS
jgi:hypothetical protein